MLQPVVSIVLPKKELLSMCQLLKVPISTSELRNIHEQKTQFCANVMLICSDFSRKPQRSEELIVKRQQLLIGFPKKAS
jgi:hypothetical protein